MNPLGEREAEIGSPPALGAPPDPSRSVLTPPRWSGASVAGRPWRRVVSRPCCTAIRTLATPTPCLAT